MSALADPARCRLLLILERQELAVSDICAVMQLPQSTVSRHLKTLADRFWVTARRDGTRHLYRGAVAEQPPAAQQLWELTRAEVEHTAAGQSDLKRLESVLARNGGRSRAFFDESGSAWDDLRDELFGSKFHLAALMALVPRECVVGDLGSGTGTVAEALAPFVTQIIGVDASTSMLGVAAQRLQRFPNVELRHGELTTLPLEDEQLDVATLMLVLHHVEQPETAIAEASRCLRPAGTILIVDMLPHDRVEYQKDMGHLWMGFSQELIEGYLRDAGFEGARFVMLPPAPEAKGPNLFAVSATKKEK